MQSYKNFQVICKKLSSVYRNAKFLEFYVYLTRKQLFPRPNYPQTIPNRAIPSILPKTRPPEYWPIQAVFKIYRVIIKLEESVS